LQENTVNIVCFDLVQISQKYSQNL